MAFCHLRRRGRENLYLLALIVWSCFLLSFWYFYIYCNVSFYAGKLPPPDISNISVTINSKVCFEQSPFLAIVLVFSHPGNTYKRRLIRDTYPAEEINVLGIRRVFVLATLRDGFEPNPFYSSITAQKTREESARHSDILQFNYTEAYRDLTLKSYAAFRWASQCCYHARHVVKIDDDVFLDYYAFAKNFSAVTDDDIDTIAGDLHTGHELALRNVSHWKWYVSYEEYPAWRYSDFVRGGFYVMSYRVANALLVGARMVPLLHIEDTFFTGLVADKMGVRRRNYKPVVELLEPATKSCCAMTGKKFECKLMAFSLEVGDRKDLKRFKEHGRFCYFNVCERYTDSVPEMTGVTCF